MYLVKSVELYHNKAEQLPNSMDSKHRTTMDYCKIVRSKAPENDIGVVLGLHCH